ncbi:SDR family oxidoreductase [Actinomadura scrupuli]|uniref:SDR family oxidoreductase n=1 Tax=Actinomadura scrupuli TaxID=559629 RepID=UPI003D976978
MSVILITGTSSGIGKAIALSLAREGHQVVATMRDLEKAAPLREAGMDVRRLDVTSEVSIADCVGGTVAAHGRLDAVVNNAGAGHLGTIDLETVADVRQVMEVNFFGVVAVTKAAMPHLRRSGGRLLTVTSVGGVIGQPFNEAYCAAKFAVEGFMEALAPVASTVGVRLSVIEPGAVASEFVANIGVDRSALITAAGAYGPAIESYLSRAGEAFTHAQPAEEVADLVKAVLSSDEPHLRYQTSDAARQFAGVKLADLDGSAVRRLTSEWIT